MGKPIRVLVTSRFALSGRALLSRLSQDPAEYRVVFRECLSKEPLPAGFRPQIVILNCIGSCLFPSPSSPVLYPFAKCLAVSRSPSVSQQALWLTMGVHGIIDEGRDSFENLERAIRAVLEGEVWAGRKVLAEFFRLRSRHSCDWSGGLNPRERDLMVLLRLGFSNASMARRMHLSEKTVKWHLTCIYQKLGVKNRTQATLRFDQVQRRAISECLPGRRSRS